MNKEAEAMIEAIQQNDLGAAVKLFKQSVEQSVLQKNSADLAELAETMHALGFLSEAKEAFSALNVIAPHVQEWNIALAEIAIDEDDYDQALDILLTIDKESDVYPQALLTMADAYQVQGMYEVSEKKIFEAMELLPDEPILDYALAQLYHSIGEYKKAIPIYEELLYGNGEIASGTQLNFFLGDCHNAIGEFETALEYLEKIPADEHFPDSYFQLGFTYFQLKEYARAITIFKKLLEADSEYLSAYLYLANALEAEHELEEALAVMEQAIARNPYQHEFYTAAARLQLKMNKEEDAERNLREAAALEPDLSSIHLALGNLLLKQGRHEELIAYIADRAEQEDTDPQYNWLLATSYHALEDYDSAHASYTSAYPHFADNESFLLEYTAFLREEGDWDKLGEVIHQGLALFPGNPDLIQLHDDLHHFDQ
jgi:tetratricopeptide (TPR) repeat protein